MIDRVKKLLIVSALKSELAYLLKFYKPEKIFDDNKKALYRKIHKDAILEFGITGVGTKNVRGFFNEYLKTNSKPLLLISTGYAGAINPNLKLNEIVIASSFICNSKRYVLKYPENIKQKISSGFGVNKILYKKEKYDLLQKFNNIDFVDMESCEIIKICKENNINFFIIRVISDTLNFEFPDLIFINKPFKKILFSNLIFKKPLTFYKVVKLNLNLHKASFTIGKFLINFIDKWK